MNKYNARPVTDQGIRFDSQEEQSPRAVTERIEAYVDKNTSGETGKVNLLHVFGRYLLAEPEERVDEWAGQEWEAAS